MNDTPIVFAHTVGISVYLGLVSFIAALLNLIVYFALARMKVLPATVLLQLKHLTAVVILNCIITICMYAIQLPISSINGFSPHNRYCCAMWGIPGNTLLALLTTSFTILALERWNATKNEVQASKEGSISAIKKVLVASWIVSIVSALACSIIQMIDETLKPRFCGSTTYSVPKSFIYPMCAMYLGSEVVLVGLYTYVWLKNRDKLAQFSLITTRYSVDERYQMRQTLKSFRMVAPSLLINLFVNVAVVIYITIKLEMYNGEYSFAGEVEFGLIIPALMCAVLILHPICLLSDKNLRNHAKAILLRRCRNQSNDVGAEPAAPTVQHAITAGNQAIMLDQFWTVAAKHNDTDVDSCTQRLLKNDPTLTTININNMKRTPIPNIQRMILAIKDNTHLKKLSLANTGLTDAAAQPLVEVIEHNCTLESINLETNYISGEFLSKFFTAALKNQTLLEVKAVNQGPTFSTIAEREIIEAINTNKGLSKVSINLRLPEGRHKIENAMLRNGEIKRIRRRNKVIEEELRRREEEEGNVEKEKQPEPVSPPTSPTQKKPIVKADAKCVVKKVK